MKKILTIKRTARLLALLLCLITLTAAFASCRKLIGTEPEGTLAPAVDNGTTTVPATTEAPAAPTVRGEGALKFALTVTFQDSTKKEYEIHTDKTNVGDALADAGVVSGSVSGTGLFIDTVDGVKADYSVDQSYWALYVNGEYSSVGASLVEVKDGLKIELRYTIYTEQ